MAARYVLRPGFDHTAWTRANVTYSKPSRRRTVTRFINFDDGDPFPYAMFLNAPDQCPVHAWLESDAAQGRWTYKFFINRLLISFDDPDTAFAFRIRWC
jgi:hypothetical protein